VNNVEVGLTINMRDCQNDKNIFFFCYNEGLFGFSTSVRENKAESFYLHDQLRDFIYLKK